MQGRPSAESAPAAPAPRPLPRISSAASTPTLAAAWGPDGVLVFVALVALAMRAGLLASTAFPINDGGLFARFVDATAASFPLLPVTTPFNGHDLPFAYPPLSFWLAAAAARLGAPTLSILHVAPIVMNMAYVLLFPVALLRMGFSRLFVAAALLIFATSFRSFEWLVMGGGLSRGLGSIFLILTLIALNRPTRAPPSGWACVVAGACVAGAVLSHLEWGLLAAASALLSLALTAKSVRTWIGQSLAVGLTAMLLVLPWVLFVYGHHGLTPFLAASTTSDWYNGWKLGPLVRAYHDIREQNGMLLPFVLAGAGGLLWRRRPFWVGFLLLALFLTPRQGPTPAALAFGVLATEGAVLAFAGLRAIQAPRLVAAALVAVALVTAMAARNEWSLRPDPNFEPLGQNQRAAMDWVARHDAHASYALVTQPAWYYDDTAEWFPYLAGARSVTTVQGTEWLPAGAFNRMRQASDHMKASTHSCPELLAALQAFPRADYVFTEVRPDCFRSAGYALAFANPSVSIWRTP